MSSEYDPLTREEELEMWLRDARSLCEWLSGHVDWSKISALAARGYARSFNGIERTLEKNPFYLQGKQDRLDGKPATSKEKAYRAGYWLGLFPNQEVPPAVDGCDWTKEHAAHEERLHQRVLAVRAQRKAAKDQ